MAIAVMPEIITIWGSDETPPDEAGVYCWNGYAETGAIQSLLRYVEVHSERLRDRYLAWIHDLGESRIRGKRLIDHLAFKDGLSYWWMTLFVEKSPYKSNITDVIRLFALEEIVIQKEPRKIRLVSTDKRLSKILSILCHRLGIDFEWDRRAFAGRRSIDIRRTYQALPQHLQALISLSRHLWQRWSFRGAEKSGWYSGDQVLFFCSYFDNVDSQAAEQGHFYSYYWCSLLALIKDMGRQTNWLQLFVPCKTVTSPNRAMRWVKLFKQTGQNRDFHSFIDAYLSWRIVLRVLRRWFWLSLIGWRLREVKNAFRPRHSQLSLWPIMCRDWKQSMYGAVAIHNLLAIELFNIALRTIPQQKKGLYLCENQAWERAFIHAWHKHGHGCLIAVAHSTVRFWDLRYFADLRLFQSTELFSMPQPDLIALNGKVAVDSCLKGNFPKRAIVECEAVRYAYLSEQNIQHRIKSAHRFGKKVLVLGDVSVSRTTSLLKLLELAVSRSSNTLIYHIKPHPNCPVRVEDYPLLNLKIVTEPLGVILQDYDVAFASNSTSAAVDAYMFGLPVVVMLDERELNFSPLREQAGIRFVSTPEELAKVLREDYCKLSSIPQNNDFFFLDTELSRWSHLLEI